LHSLRKKEVFFFKNTENTDDLVAQLVEHLTFNQVALGSNPSGITFFSIHILMCDLVAQLVEHLTFNQVALGSNPSGITKQT
jgi:hypothetical protein